MEDYRTFQKKLVFSFPHFPTLSVVQLIFFEYCLAFCCHREDTRGHVHKCEEGLKTAPKKMPMGGASEHRKKGTQDWLVFVLVTHLLMPHLSILES